ncbi:MAG: ribbon-helix-helix domain-containing protein [Cyanobacteriota bacterium]|jgi:hypothetical protein
MTSLPRRQLASDHLAFRTPKRISVSIPQAIYEDLLQQSDLQGRSLSNLAAYILENGLKSLMAPHRPEGQG